MNKLVKGSVAAATGIVLLMGGAGSLALWNDSADLTGGTVNSGTLTIASNADGEWDDALDFIVPGDTVTYTETFEVVAIGDNLDAELSSNIDTIVNGIDGSIATTEFDVVDALNAPVLPVSGVYSFGEGTYTVTVEIVVEFPVTVGNLPGEGLKGQGQAADFSAVVISLKQV